jgi:hypothetical protein
MAAKKAAANCSPDAWKRAVLLVLDGPGEHGAQ